MGVPYRDGASVSGLKNEADVGSDFNAQGSGFAVAVRTPLSARIRRIWWPKLSRFGSSARRSGMVTHLACLRFI